MVKLHVNSPIVTNRVIFVFKSTVYGLMEPQLRGNQQYFAYCSRRICISALDLRHRLELTTTTTTTKAKERSGHHRQKSSDNKEATFVEQVPTRTTGSVSQVTRAAVSERREAALLKAAAEVTYLHGAAGPMLTAYAGALRAERGRPGRTITHRRTVSLLHYHEARVRTKCH